MISEHSIILTSNPEVSVSDIEEHQAVWRGFKHLVKWFALHILVDLAGILYLLHGQVVAGIFFIAIGTSMFVYGIVTLPSANFKTL